MLSVAALPRRPTSGTKALSYTRADGTVDELAFRDGNLALVRETHAGGRLAYEVRYSDYRDIGAMQFPHTVEARFPATGTTLKLRYENPAIDGIMPDSAFVLSPGAANQGVRPRNELHGGPGARLSHACACVAG